MTALTSTWQTFFSLDRPGKIICVGLNYHDHADESGMSISCAAAAVRQVPEHARRSR
jgi:2-keto-4-pentenoate hydratase/2-oxohepta-3-ene-1,7-dioic acid hydratase in catechol pathway